jgi:hypothetical protein
MKISVLRIIRGDIILFGINTSIKRLQNMIKSFIISLNGLTAPQLF